MTKEMFGQELYPNNRPTRLAKLMGNAWAAIGSLGLMPHYVATLEVVGRKTGKVSSLPIVLAIVNGQEYLVSMMGEDVQWVKNVRAAGGKAVLRRGRRDNVLLEEVPVNQRAAILKVYLQRAPGARDHVPVNKDAPLAEFEKIAPDFPVFHVVVAAK